jgi:hypothetical protein
MIIKTTIEVGIDLEDPIGQCDDDHIKHILTVKYQGRCLREHYIQSIDRIIKRGEVIINQMSPTAFATLPIIVEVTAIIFLRGEIITGCLIKNINERAKFITCESQYANVILKQTPMFASLQVGQYVTVQVGTSQYAIGAPKIAVNGVPFLPSQSQQIYKITANNIPIARGLMKDVRARIEFEENAAEDIKRKDAKIYTIFSSLVSAYVKSPEINPAAICSLADTDRLSTYKFITRDGRISPTSPNVLAVNEAPTDRPWELSSIIEVTFAEALIAILEDYCAQLRVVREMISVYGTPELIKSHANLWNIYKMNKIDK